MSSQPATVSISDNMGDEQASMLQMTQPRRGHSALANHVQIVSTTPAPSNGCLNTVFEHAGHADPLDGWQCYTTKQQTLTYNTAYSTSQKYHTLSLTVFIGDVNAHSTLSHSYTDNHRVQLIADVIINSYHITLNTNIPTRVSNTRYHHGVQHTIQSDIVDNSTRTIIRRPTHHHHN